MNAKQWLTAYAEKLGVPAPTNDEFTAILDLAGEAAHASERVAAPVACWLAARAGAELGQAMTLAREIDADDDAESEAQEAAESEAQDDGESEAQDGGKRDG